MNHSSFYTVTIEGKEFGGFDRVITEYWFYYSEEDLLEL